MAASRNTTVATKATSENTGAGKPFVFSNHPIPRNLLMMHMFRLITGKIEKATRHSAAFDLFYSGDQPLILTDTPVAIPTNVRTIFSPGLAAIIKEKSGLALQGIELKGGVIDADYRDEWKVIARCPPH